jgi:hypothetical protein
MPLFYTFDYPLMPSSCNFKPDAAQKVARMVNELAPKIDAKTTLIQPLERCHGVLVDITAFHPLLDTSSCAQLYFTFMLMLV